MRMDHHTLPQAGHGASAALRSSRILLWMLREFRRRFEGLKGKRKERKKKGGECKKLGVSIAAAAAAGGSARHSAQRGDRAGTA